MKYRLTGVGEHFIDRHKMLVHYCYAWPSHSYLNLSPGLDFETKLFAKTNLAETLRAELAKENYVCKPINIGSNTDP